jgi:hypothetical protein
VPCLCLKDGLDNVTTSVYVVTLKQAPTSHYYGGDLTSLNDDNNGFKDNGRTQFQKPRYDTTSKTFDLYLGLLYKVIYGLFCFFLFFEAFLLCVLSYYVLKFLLHLIWIFFLFLVFSDQDV